MIQSLGAAISISKGRKHEISESPSIAAKRLIGIDDLRNDDLLRYTDDKKGVEAGPEDVLIAWDGANAGTIGYGKSGFIGSTIARLRIKPESKLCTPFLGLYLKSQFDYLRKTATGATIPHINRKALESIPLPKIERDDQIRIAHLLGKVEGLIAQRKQHLQQLDDLLKSVFLDMFGDPVRNDKGWKTVPFHKIGKFNSGATPSKSRDDFWVGTYPWVSPKDMKVSKITDSIDHISESVFEETTLKRIAPNHLLIVVRGMILAHSFPVAINTVEIAVNQDMKAIKPIKEINVIYLQNCLTALKRQILKLISTAGHGTRKFDSIAMQKLFIPKPPIELQSQFATIVEKVEALKSRYQQSLNDLESLYGALSKQAFKGELDLSWIPLPAANITAEVREAPEQIEAHLEVRSAINLPDTDYLLDALTDLSLRERLLCEWLESYCQQIGNTKFSTDTFLAATQTRIAELRPDSDFELGASDYDIVKNWVFDALAAGKLSQSLDEANNCVRLTKGKPA